MNQKYHLIGDFSVTRNSKENKRKWIAISFSLIIIVILSTLYLFLNNNQNNYDLILIKGQSRKDKYGVELNKYILNGIYNIGYDNDINKSIEDWSLYTPPCPNLQPVHYPEAISNPVCKESSLQFTNFNNDNGRGLPYSLPLNDITSQIKNWNNWKKENKGSIGPLYGEQNIDDLLIDEYHPFDYGYNGDDTSNISDDKYYKNVVNSRMDEVPDPRRRRLFSFILFNTEFNILDAYLSEYYEIVDYFVICEANSTFSGIPKPLYFTRTLLETNRYDKFKDKLIPLPMEITIDEDNGRGKAFPKEHISRRILVEKGLRAVHARHGDIFIHGDLDEFPKAHILYRMKKCGGWEYLQMGIGGGPKSFKDADVKSYFVDKTMNIPTNVTTGVYEVDYDKDISLGFLTWFNIYNFQYVKDSTIATFPHPNIAIFDARRSLGQLNEFDNKILKSENKTESGSENKNKNKNKNKDINKNVKRENYDILLDPSFDPYQGYTYTDNTNDLRIGKGYLGEEVRFNTHILSNEELKESQKPFIWNGGWHLSSFLPTFDLIYNKISSYSHFDCYSYFPSFISKRILKYRIKNHAYSFGSFQSFEENSFILPKSYNEGYQYNFKYEFWKNNIQNNSTDTEFKNNIDILSHEIPNHIWQNPICYSYMLDFNYIIDEKKWWEIIPKKDWNTAQFKYLNPSLIDHLLPKNITEIFKDEYLNAIKHNN